MAKAILEFDLGDPDDRSTHERMLKSLDLSLVLWNFDQYLRGKLKHDSTLSDDAYSALEEAREKLYSLLQDSNLDLDTLVN